MSKKASHLRKFAKKNLISTTRTFRISKVANLIDTISGKSFLTVSRLSRKRTLFQNVAENSRKQVSYNLCDNLKEKLRAITGENKHLLMKLVDI